MKRGFSTASLSKRGNSPRCREPEQIRTYPSEWAFRPLNKRGVEKDVAARRILNRSPQILLNAEKLRPEPEKRVGRPMTESNRGEGAKPAQ